MPRMSDRFVRDGRELPPELEEHRIKIEDLARKHGLDFFDTIFQMCTYEEINFLAAYGGFPTRYPHWRFGMEYTQTGKSYEYGLSKIYEMVINTDPSYAYLLDNNLLVDQKLVMAHVFGHVDFFKNNLWFAPTNRKMLDQMANHATKVRKIMDRHGQAEVEAWIDVCLSVDNLIDPYSPHIKRQADPKTEDQIEAEEMKDGRVRLPNERGEYMEDFINPPEFLDEQEKEHKASVKKLRDFPESPVRDVMGFLVNHARLPKWKQQILAIIHAEAMYFAPQGQTKVMNEGWASLWHTRLMTEHILEPDEAITYADHNSGTMAMRPGQFNPYALGIKLWRHIEERWNKGQFGKDWDECKDPEERLRWDTGAMKGKEKIFQVRQTHNDITFIDEFLTPEFCREFGFFTTRYDSQSRKWIMDSEEYLDVKDQLLGMLSSRGTPLVYVNDANAYNRGELMLEHSHDGRDIKLDWAVPTLKNLVAIWGRPVHIRTIVDGEETQLTHDGSEHITRTLDKA